MQGRITSARTGGLVLALAAVLASPGAVLAQSFEPALVSRVRDDDRGVRAIIRYYPEVMTGGASEIVNPDGTVSMLHWDGLVGQFEAEVIEGGLSGADAEAFLREAVGVVCPSADAAYVAEAPVQASGPYLRLFAQCPEVDARR